MIQWWFSFVDPRRPAGARWLGVTIVEAPTFLVAHRKTWDLGVNPGGEVLATPMLGVPEELLNRLIKSRKVLEALPTVPAAYEGDH